MITQNKWYLENYSTDITKVENYDIAINSDKKYELHHRLETHTSDGVLRTVALGIKELKALDMYFHRPPEELIFLTVSEHRKLHNIFKENPAKREDVRKKISESHKGRKQSNETKLKHSIDSSSRHWYNNGSTETFAKECPEGYTPGRLPFSKERNEKISNALKGRKTWNTGLKGYKRSSRK
jgi:hypothetical protein